jgi:hypothetical protein
MGGFSCVGAGAGGVGSGVGGIGAGTRVSFSVLHLSFVEFQAQAWSALHDALSVWTRQGSLGLQLASTTASEPIAIACFISEPSSCAISSGKDKRETAHDRFCSVKVPQ